MNTQITVEYLSVFAGKQLTGRKNHQALASRVQIGGGSRSILSNVSSLLLCNMYARANLSFVPSECGVQRIRPRPVATGTLLAELPEGGRNETYRCGIILLCSVRTTGCPRLIWRLYYLTRLMGSSLSRSLVATYHALYGLVVIAVVFAVGRDRADSLCFAVLFSFFFFPFVFFSFYFIRQVLFHDMEL